MMKTLSLNRIIYTVRIESLMVRVTMLSAQSNTASNDRLISTRVTGTHVERSRFGLVKSRNLVLP